MMSPILEFESCTPSHDICLYTVLVDLYTSPSPVQSYCVKCEISRVFVHRDQVHITMPYPAMPAITQTLSCRHLLPFLPNLAWGGVFAKRIPAPNILTKPYEVKYVKIRCPPHCAQQILGQSLLNICEI